ncbi:21431_t:CDS:2 [Gigaspora rosea]|nr:21431_t:CDS:2 [Gigaspora rosea]
MSVSSSQSGDVIIEVKTEEIGSEVKKDDSEFKDIKDKDESEIKDDEIEDYREYPNKYMAISPEGDFLVELVLKDFDFELQMYDIKISNNKDVSEQKSYRELSRINTTFKFTNGQINLSKDKDVDKNLFRWSVAVSDKSTSSSEFRLLAISYISLKDLEYYKKNFDNIHLTQIPNHGFTFVFIIKIINNVYSISDFKDKELPIKYSG